MIVTLDAETYYDKEYSLKKMTPVLYVRDPRFKVHGWAWQIDDGEPQFTVDLPDIDWSQATVVAHNAPFDGLILVERYGIHPKQWVDTLGLARGLIQHLDSYSLDYLAKAFGIRGKIKGTLESIEGVRELTPEQFKALGKYANNDVEITKKIFDKLWPLLPNQERRLMHTTIRWAVDGKLVGDAELFDQVSKNEQVRQQELFDRVPLTKAQLSSNKQFAEWVENTLGECPMKISATTGKLTPALGKSDIEFHKFRAKHHEYVDVWEARIAAKSTIKQTRADRFAAIARTGPMIMPLNYRGAHTGRWSGGQGLNVQNLPRFDKADYDVLKAGGVPVALRAGFMAPKGFRILVIDSAQIELRVNAWFAGETRILDVQRSGGDIYVDTAAQVYSLANDQIDKDKRQFGKLIQLGCGYGVGWNKFQIMATLQGIPINEVEAQRAIQTYRETYFNIPAMWRRLNDIAIPAMYSGEVTQIGPIEFGKEYAELPDGMLLQYPGLEPTEEGWMFKGGKKKLYGGLLDENGVQALAKIIVADQILEVEDETSAISVSSTHDEGIFIVPEEDADAALAKGLEIFSTPPDWAPDLPLSAEGGHDARYTK